MNATFSHTRKGPTAASIDLVMRAGGGAFFGVVALFALSSAGLVIELLIGNATLGQLIDHGSTHFTSRTSVMLGSVVVIAGLVAFATAAASGLHKLVIERTVRFCSESRLKVASRISLLEFENPEFHDRLERARRNEMSSLTVAMAVPQMLSAAIGGLGILLGLVFVSPWLVPITLLSALPLWLVGRANTDEMYSFSFGNAPHDRQRGHIEDIIIKRENAPEVRSFRLAGYLQGRWGCLYDERLNEVEGVVRRYTRRSAIGAVASTAVLLGVFALVIVLVEGGSLRASTAPAALIAVLLLSNRAQSSVTSLTQANEHGRYVGDFLELADLAGTLPEPQTIHVEPFTELAAEHVSFRYPAADNLALDDVSFRLRRGEVVAIVGHNGSGKTTLAKLMAGLYPPTSGVIRWDGRPLADLTPDGGLSEVGVVFQEFGRYWFSAADNIAVGSIDRIGDEEGVRRAADRAGVTEFVTDLSQGFDTPLGVEVEGGTDLSGGQWQRIAIARVLFRNASFLILDEPTAALDAEAEAALFETIADLAAGRTVVLVSHRFSTVRSADRILVMHRGRLVEAGTHGELMAVGGRYARMYSVQARAYADPHVATGA
ncbi:MAG: ABC transporter ATP-binding protein [Mycobacteriales bacterium]